MGATEWAIWKVAKGWTYRIVSYETMILLLQLNFPCFPAGGLENIYRITTNLFLAFMFSLLEEKLKDKS